MNYYINPSVFSAVFTVPTAVVDEHLKLAKGEHIKVLLYIMRNMTSEISASQISAATGISSYDVDEALIYWAEAGILASKDAEVNLKKQKTKTQNYTEKPGRTDVAKRGAEDPKIKFLLGETQQRLGRNLKTNETSTLVWLYDDQGLDVSLILMIIQYAVAHNKANIRFIETTAMDWVNKGIDNIAAADDELRRLAMGEQAWNVVQKAFGMERRKPSIKEIELSLLWVDEWKLSSKMLMAAYEACVDAKSKFSIAYIAKILENWHKKGWNSPEDIKDTPKNDDGYAAYDIDLFEKMLNSKD